MPCDGQTKNQGRRSNGSVVRGETDGWTDGRTLPSALSPYFAVDNDTSRYWMDVYVGTI